MTTTSENRKIRAAVVREKGGLFLLEDIELNTRLRPDEVLIRIVAAGVCQTDAHVRDQDLPVPLPLVLGHEGAGVVEAVGDAVVSIEIGDHVVLSYPSCGHCHPCLQGTPAYCEHGMQLCFGGSRLDGSTALSKQLPDNSPELIHGHFFAQSSFATYAIASERNVITVPGDLPLELLAPIGCGIQTGAGAILNSLQLALGTSIAVFGAGAVGLSAVMAAIIAGATTIIAVDVNDERLALASTLGATHTINGKKEDTKSRIKEIAKSGVDYVLEITAHPPMLTLALEVLGPLGTAALIGGAPAGTKASIDMNTLLAGHRLRGIVQGDAVSQIFIPRLIEFYRAGQFPIDKLIRYYDFKDINLAFADAKSGKTIKPVLKMGVA
ncbi:MAG: NAD(P)-dependent alcohol dehydrogenase [Chitinophagaceae bacterium]|nr:NAD(P)-dependent alcohol dehydrogenase [Chitinophagaceae bacterium]